MVGNNLARRLLGQGWQVSGLARRPPEDIKALQPPAADLLDPAGLQAGLEKQRPTHVFITTWQRQPTEAENIRVNAAIVRNPLDALRPGGSVRHVALVTGLKHYLGPFENYGKGSLPATPFREVRSACLFHGRVSCFQVLAGGGSGSPSRQCVRRAACRRRGRPAERPWPSRRGRPPRRRNQSAYWPAAWMIGRQRATSSARNRRW